VEGGVNGEAKRLLSMPISIERRNMFGLTPVAVAVRKGNFEATRMLIKHKTNAKAQEPTEGITSLH